MLAVLLLGLGQTSTVCPALQELYSDNDCCTGGEVVYIMFVSQNRTTWEMGDWLPWEAELAKSWYNNGTTVIVTVPDVQTVDQIFHSSSTYLQHMVPNAPQVTAFLNCQTQDITVLERSDVTYLRQCH